MSSIWFLIVLALIQGVSGCKNCTGLEIVSVQTLCSNENNELVDEQKEFKIHNNQTKFCSVLFNFFFCVGQNIPECTSRITEMYASYYSSPYDCHPDIKITKKLQEYARSVVCGTTSGPTKHTTEMTSFIVHVTSNREGNTGTNSAQISSRLDFTAVHLVIIQVLSIVYSLISR